MFFYKTGEIKYSIAKKTQEFMSFFVSCPFFIPSSIGTLPIYIYTCLHIHFSYHKTGKDHALYPVIQMTHHWRKPKAAVWDTLCLFSVWYHIPPRGVTKSAPAERGCHSCLMSSCPASKVWQKQLWQSHNKEQHSHLKQGAYSHGVHNLGTSCFSLHFRKTRTDLKENSVWTSIIFLL